MGKYNWDDPPVGLATVLAALGVGNGSGGGLTTEQVEALIAAIPPVPPGVAYKGAYTTGEYVVGDLVTAGGRLLICTTAYDAVDVAPEVVGATGTPWLNAAATAIALPAGSAAGDTAIITTDAYCAQYPAAPAGPAYATLIDTALNASNASVFSVRVWSYVLTGADITAGSLALTANGTGYDAGLTLTVYRSISSIGEPVNSTDGGNGPSITAGAPCFLHQFAGAPSSGGLATATEPALSNVVSAGGGGNCSVASGTEVSAGAASTPRAWDWVGTGNLTSYGSAGVIPLFTGSSVDLSKWDVLSAS